MSHKPQPSCTLSSVMMVQPQRCPLGFATSCIQHVYLVGCSGATEVPSHVAQQPELNRSTQSAALYLLVLDAWCGAAIQRRCSSHKACQQPLHQGTTSRFPGTSGN
jgi:hypothetical protein